ncbi:MAG: FecR domain-containing protein, partial [Bacteroidetes bacterium]|nr:FecR domain-containing protein [Bacteroidota bacterium]
MKPATIIPPAGNTALAQPVIMPGANKAMLTLGNGIQVMLDSVHGSLAQTDAVNDKGVLHYDNKPAALEFHTLSTPRGGQYRLTLPDGTNVWLNAASAIRYPTAFTGAERTVEISGEAYLEVAKNKTQPFIVRAAGTNIEVLGTSFNINAYPDEPAQNTTLVEGSVRVTGAGHAP